MIRGFAGGKFARPFKCRVKCCIIHCGIKYSAGQVINKGDKVALL